MQLNKSINYFIQVNIGNEFKNLEFHTMKLMDFIIIVLKKKMNILGLMIIPPNDNKTKSIFKVYLN